jgi:hypothetical protein|tara:strand:- start:366 stop:533 length:168 start_codon:yes stop_codon:yes gene_type:complete
MSETKTDTIASRIKQRTQVKARPGRVGGTEHKKLILLRRKQVMERQNAKKRNIEC